MKKIRREDRGVSGMLCILDDSSVKKGYTE